MIYYKRSQRNQCVFEIILRVTTRSHSFWFWVSIISPNLYVCFWWQSLWKKGLLSCCLFPPRTKLTQFHSVIIPQLPYNRELVSATKPLQVEITSQNVIFHSAVYCTVKTLSIFKFFCFLSWKCKMIKLLLSLFLGMNKDQSCWSLNRQSTFAVQTSIM